MGGGKPSPHVVKGVQLLALYVAFVVLFLLA